MKESKLPDSEGKKHSSSYLLHQALQEIMKCDYSYRNSIKAQRQAILQVIAIF